MSPRLVLQYLRCPVSMKLFSKYDPGEGAIYPTWYRCLNKTTTRKGNLFRGGQCAALSSFRVGKIQLLYKRVGFSGSNGKKKSLLRVAKISEAVERGSFSDNTAKSIVFTEPGNTLFRALSLSLCSSIGTQLGAKHPPPPPGKRPRTETVYIDSLTTQPLPS